MHTPLSLKYRSEQNHKLVKKIKEEKLSSFYECTIHNAYYSVYQRMKTLLCPSVDEENQRVPHRSIGNNISIGERCKTKILEITPEETNWDFLTKVNILYRARLVFDYQQKTNVLDYKTFCDYYCKMKEVNKILDAYIKKSSR